MNSTENIEDKRVLQGEYTETNHQIRKAERKEEKKTESLAQLAESAAATENQRMLYNTTKQLANKNYTHCSSVIRYKNNTIQLTRAAG